MSSRTERGRWVRAVLPVTLLVLMAAVVTMGLPSLHDTGGPSARQAYLSADLVAAKTGASASSTTTALTMAQWKQRYQPVVTHLADDALAVVKDGAGTSSTNRSKLAAQARRTVTACNRWRRDSERALHQAPAIPSPAAQASWRALVVASGRAAEDCSRVLTTRNPSDAKDFRTELGLVYRAEGQLGTELNGGG